MAACLHVAQSARAARGGEGWPGHHRHSPGRPGTGNRGDQRRRRLAALVASQLPVALERVGKDARRAGAGGQLIESCVAVAIERPLMSRRAPAFKRVEARRRLKPPAPRARSARACARCPSGSRPASRRCGPRGGRNRQRDVVGGACARHGAHRRRRADAFGDLRIGGGGANRNLAQRFHTRRWKAVPRTSSGRFRPSDGLRRSPPPRPPSVRTRRRRRSGGLAEAFLQAAHQVFGVFV